jgi:hypothetical protein
MKRLGSILGLSAALLLAAAIPIAAAIVVITFDDLPPQPANGLHHSLGVSFGFTVAGAPSTDATYAGAGPGQICFVQDPSLEGNAAGTLTLDFDVPTASLEFGVALSSLDSLPAGARVELFDAEGTSLGAFDVPTAPCVSFTEGQFSYPGPDPVSRAAITFFSAAGRFAVDNLSFDNGTPSAPRAHRAIAPAGAGWQK